MASISRTRTDRAARRLAASALAVALLAVGSPARAQSTDPAFDEGRALMTKGDFVGACAKFKESFDKAPSAGRAFNLSACEEKQGHFTKAISWLDAGLGQLAPDDSRATDATAKRVELLGAMPKLTVKLASGDPAATEITANGNAIPIGVRTPVDPGHVVIVVQANGRVPATTSVDLQPKEVRSVDVSVGAPMPAAPQPVAPPPALPVGAPHPASPPTERGGGGRVLAGWIIGGVGAAATLGAVVTGSIMLAKNAAYHGCPKSSGEDRCASEEDARKLGQSLEIPNAVLWAGGLATLGAGIIMIVVPRPESTASAVVLPSVGPGFAGVSVHGAF